MFTVKNNDEFKLTTNIDWHATNSYLITDETKFGLIIEGIGYTKTIREKDADDSDSDEVNWTYTKPSVNNKKDGSIVMDKITIDKDGRFTLKVCILKSVDPDKDIVEFIPIFTTGVTIFSSDTSYEFEDKLTDYVLEDKGL